MADLAVLVNGLTKALEAIDDVRRETVDEEVAGELNIAMTHVNTARSILGGTRSEDGV